MYRGNPFQIEVALAYGGANVTEKLTMETLDELLQSTDARTIRQFLINTFDGLGMEAADKIIKEGGFSTRQSASKMKRPDRLKLFQAMKNVNVSDGQSMQVLRYANRVPLQFKQRDCAITQGVIANNWRSYGLSQSRGGLPNGPVTVMVHIASVWVPFTSESKEAIAAYPEIEKELRLALQAVGRKLGMYLRKRKRAKQEGERRSVFLRYLGEVASAVNDINGADREKLYNQLLKVAKRKTAEADVKLDRRGKPLEEDDQNYGKNVLIVDQSEEDGINRPQSADGQNKLF